MFGLNGNHMYLWFSQGKPRPRCAHDNKGRGPESIPRWRIFTHSFIPAANCQPSTPACFFQATDRDSRSEGEMAFLRTEHNHGSGIPSPLPHSTCEKQVWVLPTPSGSPSHNHEPRTTSKCDQHTHDTDKDIIRRRLEGQMKLPL